MSPTDTTYRHIPDSFEDFVERERAEPAGRQRCDCCGQTRDCWLRPTLNPSTDCEHCLRRHHAFELQEEQRVRTLLDKLGEPGCRVILELFDMGEDDRLPELMRGISAEIVEQRSPDD